MSPLHEAPYQRSISIQPFCSDDSVQRFDNDHVTELCAGNPQTLLPEEKRDHVSVWGVDRWHPAVQQWQEGGAHHVPSCSCSQGNTSGQRVGQLWSRRCSAPHSTGSIWQRVLMWSAWWGGSVWYTSAVAFIPTETHGSAQRGAAEAVLSWRPGARRRRVLWEELRPHPQRAGQPGCREAHRQSGRPLQWGSAMILPTPPCWPRPFLLQHLGPLPFLFLMITL